MKIMNILTLRYLKANKKRSLLTLLCIMVSVIMMSCVGIAFSSGKAYYKSYIEKTREITIIALLIIDKKLLI